MAEVSVRDVSKRFGATAALDGVSMDFADGGFCALLGPSGSGKTTLLRVIAGFVAPDAGAILIGGRSVARTPVEKRDIGFMFQNYALFPNMSVAENVGFGLRARKVGAAAERRRVAEALALVRLDGLGDRRPHALSGGQKQRVALARAFVTNPQVLLLDEPLSALDKALRVEMQSELKRIQREIGITTIFVTHDQEEALTLADRVGILREGRLIETGAPREVYNAPSTVFAARFLGDANIFEGRAEGAVLRLPDGTAVRIPPGSDGAAAFAVRPENMRVSLAPPDAPGVDSVRGDLVQRVFAGAMTTCVVTVCGRPMKIVAPDREVADLPEAGPVWVSWDRARMMAIPHP
ncbi:MAG: ABC transporter ATP-binding protein [Rhodobacteraceae bacterium]|nr:MAG: ABC transporter ATP-binding protein [Paracoccaceae bacterium]